MVIKIKMEGHPIEEPEAIILMEIVSSRPDMTVSSSPDMTVSNDANMNRTVRVHRKAAKRSLPFDLAAEDFAAKVTRRVAKRTIPWDLAAGELDLVSPTPPGMNVILQPDP